MDADASMQEHDDDVFSCSPMDVPRPTFLNTESRFDLDFHSALVLAHVNGVSTVAELESFIGISSEQLEAALQSLVEQKLVVFTPPPTRQTPTVKVTREGVRAQPTEPEVKEDELPWPPEEASGRRKK